MESKKEEGIFHHFSHHHPLILSPNSPPAARKISCFGCKLSIMPEKDCYYHCKICNFSLHKVCYNMPKKTRHCGHPDHLLNLLVMPPSAKDDDDNSNNNNNHNFKCKACDQIITGFYYNCGQCGFFYHSLCLSLPLSVSINSHYHSINLEFSLPYDFKCDICYKPCYNGWLYRCQFCEFDAHLGCAIINQKTQSHHEHGSITDPLKRQIIYSSNSITESRRKMIDNGSENSELMELVSQGIGKNNVAVTGWDDKLYSPRRDKLKLRNGVIEFSGKIQSKQNMSAISPIPGGNSENIDQSSTLSSYQLSDSYFSIDLAKSYSGFNDQPDKDGSFVQDVEEKIKYKNNYVLDRIAENSEPVAKQELWRPNFGFHYGPEYKINIAFLNNGGNETKNISGIRNQRYISEPERARGSCWWKLFNYCCCYYPKYERETMFPQA